MFLSSTPSDSNKGKAVYIQGGNPIIKNSIFNNNYYGVYILSSEPDLENLVFEDNTYEICKDGRCMTYEEYKDLGGGP